MKQSIFCIIKCFVALINKLLLCFVTYMVVCELNIFSVPPKITPFSFRMDLHLGERVGVQCVISKGDPPLTVVWLKDGTSLTEPESGTRSGVVIHSLDQFNSILTIEALARHHGGNYTCIASNAVAQTQYTASLSVNGTVLKSCI